jgi:hypothetical protein
VTNSAIKLLTREFWARVQDDGTVVRTHVQRPTWHFVRAEDAGARPGFRRA